MPGHEEGIIWNDPKIGIDWKINKQDIVVSDKDQLLKRFKESF